MTATFYVGDAVTVMNTLPEKSVDLVISSPPFLALRSYLPQDHPDKALEGGSQATPGEYIDWLLDVVEACTRVLAPHGSLVFELGDTYAGSGGNASPDGYGDEKYGGRTAFGTPTGKGWPQAKSLSLIPESFRWAMVYGHNPHTGRKTEPWRLRNVIRWVRPNPPVGALGDKFRPATSELMVFCKAKDRFFDLDAVREPYKYPDQIRAPLDQFNNGQDVKDAKRGDGKARKATLGEFRAADHPGAPPLDWWNIPLLDGEEAELVGLLINDDEFIPRSLVEYPFAPPPGVQVRAVFAYRYGERVLSEPWTVPLLEDDEPTRYGPKRAPSQDGWQRSGGAKFQESKNRPEVLRRYEVNTSHPLGSPPLDWWNIPPGGYSGFTTWKTKVAVDPATYDGFAGDIQRTVSADCPEHGDQADPVSTESHDEREANAPIRNRGKGNHPAQGQLTDFAPTDPLLWPNLEDGSSDSPDPESIPAAIPRSKSTRKKVPVPATSPLDTPSVESPGRIGDMSESPLSDEPRPDTQGSRTSEVCPFGCSPETCDHNSDIPSAPLDEACTCSYYVEKANNTSHYAVWPPELLVKPIKAMCPESVCRVCGEARRRIVGEATYAPSESHGGTAFTLDMRANNRKAPGVNQWTSPGNQSVTRQAPTLGFSDCGHDDYRSGVVLDPFAGSGTTLSVATGHGRDAIGIDIDSRNFDLALERVGPLILQLGNVTPPT